MAFLIMLLFGFAIFLAYATLVALFLYLFRRRFNFFREDQVTTRGSIYAPVTGKVISVKNIEANTVEVAIKMNIFSGYGIYLPISARVNNVVFNDAKFGTKITLEDQLERKVRLFFENSIFKRDPELVIMPGDLGRRQVDIGFYPFGAVVKLQVENAKQIINLNDRVSGGETIIGRFIEELNEH